MAPQSRSTSRGGVRTKPELRSTRRWLPVAIVRGPSGSSGGRHHFDALLSSDFANRCRLPVICLSAFIQAAGQRAALIQPLLARLVVAVLAALERLLHLRMAQRLAGVVWQQVLLGHI